MIYLIRAGDRIKIGYATDVAARVKTLQTASPTPLVLLAAFPGERAEESALHRRFAHLRTTGEWFRADPELLTIIGDPSRITTTLLQESFSMTPLSFVTLNPTAPPPLRLSSSFRTLDQVLGGGFVAGSVLLLSGDPGAGKSTLALQVAAYVACRGYSAVYAAAEEDPAQVQLRAARLGLAAAPARLVSTDDAPALVAALDSPHTAPTLLVVDSLQRFRDPANPAPPATPTQTRLVLAQLIAHARRRQTITIVVSHVNKSSRASGTNDLQHDVDVLLHLYAVQDRRILRAGKNRFGPTDVQATFRMTGEGIRE